MDRFYETLNFVMVAHQMKIKRFIDKGLEHQPRLQTRATFVKGAFQLSQACATVKMRFSPCLGGVVDGLSDNLPLIF